MIGDLLDIGGKLLDRLIPDKAQQRAAKVRLLELAEEGELRELEARMSAIRTEAASADAWTSRARPTFMYVVYLVVIVNVLLAPLVGVFQPEAMATYFRYTADGFAAIPGEVWATFTAGYLGYAGLRTYEKKKGVTK